MRKTVDFGYCLNSQVPESPSWLLSKGHRHEALRSLQWLRGWASPKTVQQEFVELQIYSSKSNACVTCAKLMLRCKHPKPTFCDKIKELKRRQNILPLILVVGLQCLNEFNGPHVMRPYMIQVLNALGTPIQANLVTVFISGCGIFGCIVQMLALKSLGKRRIYLIAILVLALSCFGLSQLNLSQNIPNISAFYFAFYLLLLFSQVFMALFSFHSDGNRWKFNQMNPQEI